MFSKLTLSCITVSMGISLILGAGCGLRENPATSSQLSAATSGCMDKASDQLHSFLNGTASEADVNSIWTCTSTALQEFADKTRGSNDGSYSVPELRAFISKYFFHDLKITDPLMKQIGILKASLIGGDPGRLTRDEITRIQALLKVINAQSLRVRLYMPIQNLDANGNWAGLGAGNQHWSDMSSTAVDTFEQTLISVASQLGAALGQGGVPYTFDDLTQFVQELRNAVPDTADYHNMATSLDSLLKHIDLVREAKNTLLSPDSKVLAEGSDWQDLFTTAANWAGVAIRGVWYMDSDRLARTGQHGTSGEGLKTLNRIFDRAEALLLESMNRRDDKTIKIEELENLAMALPDGSLPIKDANLKISVKPLIQRVLGGSELGPDGREAAGINPSILKKMEDAYYNWSGGQVILVDLYQKLGQDSNGYVRDTLLSSEIAKKFWTEVDSKDSSHWGPISKLASHRLQQLIAIVRPLYMGDDNEMTFPKHAEGTRYSLNDLYTMNWMQALSRMLLRGYAEKDASEDPRFGAPVRGDVDNIGISNDPKIGMGISFTEFDKFFHDFKPLGVDLKVFDPDDPNASYNHFREGDVFTYVSNGNGYIDLEETTSLLGFAVSAFKKSDRIHTDIAAQCPSLPHGDKYGKPLIDDKCYRKVLFGNVDKYWTHMSELHAFYKTLSTDQLESFQYLLEVSGRKKGYQLGTWMNSDDSQGFVGALQYVEALFTRYDIKENGLIDQNEAQDAFPAFKRTLQQVAQKMTPPTSLNDWEANLVFTYMLSKGKMPKGSMPVLGWWAQKNLLFAGKFEADRIRILQIFANISTGGTASMTVPGAAPSPSPEPSPTASPTETPDPDDSSAAHSN